MVDTAEPTLVEATFKDHTTERVRLPVETWLSQKRVHLDAGGKGVDHLGCDRTPTTRCLMMTVAAN